MGWPLRMFQEEGYYFETFRCFQGGCCCVPAGGERVVRGVLVRAPQPPGRCQRTCFAPTQRPSLALPAPGKGVKRFVGDEVSGRSPLTPSPLMPCSTGASGPRIHCPTDWGIFGGCMEAM